VSINPKKSLAGQQPEGTAAGFLTAADAGQPQWWQKLSQLGTPLIEPAGNNQVKMNYFWRDPAGTEQHSAIVRVYIDINGITDHHSREPQSLQRLAGTDIWHGSATVDARWRGSYSLIPIVTSQLPPVFSRDDSIASQQQREWWISLFPLAIADPFNPLRNHFNSRRQPLSAAHMPDAPRQSGWLAWDHNREAPIDYDRLQQFNWLSTLLDNQRRIWLYTSGDTSQPATRPLVILLDGQNWAQNIPLFSVLEQQTAAGLLPAACWVFIDVIDMDHREQELPCNQQFWQAIQQELLPEVRRREDFSDDPQRTVVAGQSYGGLAAMYAGLHWPQRFGRVLSQSGSFWWPEVKFITQPAQRGSYQPGWLIGQVAENYVAEAPLTIFLEYGDREETIGFVNQQMLQALSATGHRIIQREFIGGHDSLCWRGGLLDGLQLLLSEDRAK